MAFEQSLGVLLWEASQGDITPGKLPQNRA